MRKRRRRWRWRQFRRAGYACPTRRKQQTSVRLRCAANTHVRAGEKMRRAIFAKVKRNQSLLGFQIIDVTARVLEVLMYDLKPPVDLRRRGGGRGSRVFPHLRSTRSGDGQLYTNGGA